LLASCLLAHSSRTGAQEAAAAAIEDGLSSTAQPSRACTRFASTPRNATKLRDNCGSRSIARGRAAVSAGGPAARLAPLSKCNLDADAHIAALDLQGNNLQVVKGWGWKDLGARGWGYMN